MTSSSTSTGESTLTHQPTQDHLVRRSRLRGSAARGRATADVHNTTSTKRGTPESHPYPSAQANGKTGEHWGLQEEGDWWARVRGKTAGCSYADRPCFAADRTPAGQASGVIPRTMPAGACRTSAGRHKLPFKVDSLTGHPCGGWLQLADSRAQDTPAALGGEEKTWARRLKWFLASRASGRCPPPAWRSDAGNRTGTRQPSWDGVRRTAPSLASYELLFNWKERSP